MAVVYLHRKETDNSIFYVGIGNKKSRANERRGRNDHWTRVFNKYGLTVELIQEGIDIESAKELEIFLIQEIGIENLCNQTLGGEGFFGGKHSEESKAKMRSAALGKTVSDETRKKLSEAGMRHEVTEESRRKIGIGNTGNKVWLNRNHTQEAKDKISKANKGKKPTRECIKASIESRRKNGIKIKELTTGIEFMLRDSYNHFNIVKDTISKNSLTDEVLINKRYTGLNFTKI